MGVQTSVVWVPQTEKWKDERAMLKFVNFLKHAEEINSVLFVTVKGVKANSWGFFQVFGVANSRLSHTVDPALHQTAAESHLQIQNQKKKKTFCQVTIFQLLEDH